MRLWSRRSALMLSGVRRYMFFCMDYFMIGVILFSRFPSFFLSRPLLAPFYTHHSLISFLLIIFGTAATPLVDIWRCAAASMNLALGCLAN